MPGVRVIVSCREYDLKYDQTLNDLANRQLCYKLGNFSIEQVAKILSANSHTRSLSEKLLKFLGNPLNLSLFLKIDRQDIALEALNLDALYDILWQRHIIDGSVIHHLDKEKLVGFLDSLADSMHREQTLSIPEIRLVAEYDKEIRYLSTYGFIRQKDHMIQFAHQTLSDYVYARRFVESGKSLLDEMHTVHQGLFIRSKVSSVLQYYRTHDPRNYTRTLTDILFGRNGDGSDSVRFHLKVLALSLMAYHDSPLDSEIRLIHNRIMPDPDLRPVFLRAVHTQAWMDVVFRYIDNRETWKGLTRHDRDIIIGACCRMSDTDCGYTARRLSDILEICGEEDKEAIKRHMSFYSPDSSSESVKQLYDTLKKHFDAECFPSFLESLSDEYPDFVVSETLCTVSKIISDSDIKSGHIPNLNRKWLNIFDSLDRNHPDKAIHLCICILEHICKETAYNTEHVISQSSAYFDLNPTDDRNIRHDFAGYILNYPIKTLTRDINDGKDRSDILERLAHSEYEPVVYIALKVLHACAGQLSHMVHDMLMTLPVLCDAPVWVEYMSCELLRASFKHFDNGRKRAIIDRLMNLPLHNESRMCYESNLHNRLLYGIPLTYAGRRRGILLNAIPADELKICSNEAWMELQRLKRKFRYLENHIPLHTSCHCGWGTMDKQRVVRMDNQAWISSMIKYNTDSHHDFTTPTLTGQSRLFRENVKNEPDRFYPFILEVIYQEDISLKYIQAGFEGLVEAGRIDMAVVVFERLINYIGNDLNTAHRNFSLHLLLFSISPLINAEKLPPQIFDFICRAIYETDDSHDMDNHMGFDLVTAAINRTRGNAVYTLVKCEKFPEYHEKIFRTLEDIAPTAGVFTRAAALVNMGVLSRIDPTRSLRLFKALVHDFDPRLLSMPLHNFNPVLSFIMHAFDELEDYFSHVVEYETAHKENVKILWLAWYQTGSKSAKDFLDSIMERNPGSRASLVSFIETQMVYDDKAMEYVLKYIDDPQDSAEMAQSVDAILSHIPCANRHLEKMLSGFIPMREARRTNHGLFKLMKRLAKSNPAMALKCINSYVHFHNPDDYNDLNTITEILITAYNGLRRFDDEELMPELEKAMDLLDRLMKGPATYPELYRILHVIDNE